MRLHPDNARIAILTDISSHKSADEWIAANGLIRDSKGGIVLPNASRFDQVLYESEVEDA